MAPEPFLSLNRLLPLWIVMTALVAISQTFMAYHRSLREGDPLHGQTPHAARLFGTWTFLAGVLRMYAAFKIETGNMYTLAMWSYGIAAAHYAIEGFVFGTPDPGRKWALIVSVSTLAWMTAQAGFYLQST